MIRVSTGLSDSVHDDSLVTSKSVPSYCDVIDDNMAPNCHHPLYHHQYYHHHHNHWTVAPPPLSCHHHHVTVAPPPPSYSSTNWDATPRPLQPSAPHVDSAHSPTRCDDDVMTSPRVTSRTHYVMDSAAVSNQDTIHSSGDSLLPITCPQCRQQRPACV